MMTYRQAVQTLVFSALIMRAVMLTAYPNPAQKHPTPTKLSVETAQQIREFGPVFECRGGLGNRCSILLSYGRVMVEVDSTTAPELLSPTMADVSEGFLKKSRDLLVSDYLPKVEQCLARLSDEDIWWRPNDGSNSIGNLVLHLCGNVTQWIIGGVGDRPFERHRQKEFDQRDRIPTAELLRRLNAVVQQADDVLRTVDGDGLLSKREIQGYSVTGLEAIYHVVEHFAMHTGQIILLTKARTGVDLKLWERPSVSRPG